MVGTENLLARPQEAYAEVLGFLGLREGSLDDFPEHNKKPYSAIEPDVEKRSSRSVTQSPTNAWSTSSAAVRLGRAALVALRREQAARPKEQRIPRDASHGATTFGESSAGRRSCPRSWSSEPSGPERPRSSTFLRHPDLHGPAGGRGEVTWAGKEIHFFDERFLLGPTWYRSFFPLTLQRRRARAPRR